MKTIKYFFILALFVAMSCQTAQEKVGIIESIKSPANMGSEEPNLFTDSKGDVYLSWIEKDGKQAKLLYAKLKVDRWSASNMISEGNNWFVNWADYPSLVVNNELMTAHWLQKRAEGTYDYDVRMMMSNNSGSEWNESFVPHTDGVSAEHGFVSMLPMDGNKVFATWLDGRYTKGERHEGDGHSDTPAMTLRGAIFDNEGNALEEWELDHRVCDCCQTSVAMTANGPAVVYRNRTEDEIRDMSIVRFVNGIWTAPKIIHSDNWNIAGCPVNGPAIAANDNAVAVAWFTASDNKPKVKMSLSDDAGASFSAPIIISEGSTNGRVGITMMPDQSIVVSWMETKDEMAQIMLGHYDNQGTLLKKMEIAQSTSSRNSGFPVITSSGNKVYMAWTETGENSEVRTALVKF